MQIKKTLALLLFCLVSAGANAQIQQVKMDGYIGGRVDDCIRNRILGQNADELVEPFLLQDEVNSRWASEFWGKWVQGAIATYQYTHDPVLYAKIKDAEEKLMATQLEDGYIGDYDKAHQLTGWDVWGRKYTLLGLLKWYKLSGDKNALKSACRLLDYTISQLGPGKKHIYEAGLYRGMPPCSILEPVMFMYGITKDERYLEFAKYIVEDGENGHQLIAKCDVPVAQRFVLGPGESWWSFLNGQKAYEMMSCYVGMLELYRVTGDEKLLNAARTAYRHIVDEEINICGSGASLECWYGGRQKQAVPAMHTMETCVTFTWMQFNERLMDFSDDSCYADQIERSMYNALMASMKYDGSQIVKYVPLEGFRREGENQCDVHMNCCNANAPRGFAMIPRVMYRMPKDDELDVNLYIPSTVEMKVGKAKMKLEQVTEYPRDGRIVIRLSSSKPVRMTMKLRIPDWSAESSLTVNGESVPDVKAGTYCTLEREWKDGDELCLDLDMRARMIRLSTMAAIQRGPVVFARDSRFGDGDVDECVMIGSKDGYVDARLADPRENMWITLEVPAMLGTYGDSELDSTMINLCDFASAGNTWDRGLRYRLWLPRLYNPDKPYGGDTKGYW